MTLTAIIFLFSGFYLLYNTSKKAQFPRPFFSVFIQNNSKAFSAFGLLLILISLYMNIEVIGLGAGIFMTLVLLMLMASLLVLLYPLKQSKIKNQL